MLINLSICLTDIPKEKITVSEKNGKKYLSVAISDKDADHYGNTATIWVNQSKEEREAKVKRVYLGNGKVVFNDNKQQPQTTTTYSKSASADDFNNAPSNVDDLPF